MSGDPGETREFLEELYGTADAGYLAIFHLPTQRTEWVPATELELATATIQRAGQTGNVYVGVGLQAVPLGPRQRGTTRTVVGLPGLFMDLDLAGGEHKQRALPGTLREVATLVRRAIALDPSLIVSSGGGVHVYWLWHEVWAFESDEERDTAARMNRVLQAAIIVRGREQGWTLDATADLARVLRPAGTVNRKRPAEPLTVRILHQSGQRYGIDELEEFLPADLIDLHPRRATTHREGSPPSALWGHITAGCPFLAHCVHDRSRLSEPEWHAAMTIVGRCRDGEVIAHEISQGHPGYNPVETDKKFDHAQRNDAPLRCETIRYLRGGEAWCRRCPHWGAIASPIVLGYPRGYRHGAGRSEHAG